MVSTMLSTSTQHTFKHVILRTPMHAHMLCYLTLLFTPTRMLFIYNIYTGEWNENVSASALRFERGWNGWGGRAGRELVFYITNCTGFYVFLHFWARFTPLYLFSSFFTLWNMYIATTYNERPILFNNNLQWLDENFEIQFWGPKKQKQKIPYCLYALSLP